jgi:ACS family allantoate permease-like MFS transporter
MLLLVSARGIGYEDCPASRVLTDRTILPLSCQYTAARFAPFFALRFLLGAFESVVAPTLITTVAAFYPKREQASRIASFYMCNGLTQMFGPLVAYGK